MVLVQNYLFNKFWGIAYILFDNYNSIKCNHYYKIIKILHKNDIIIIIILSNEYHIIYNFNFINLMKLL